MGRKAKEVEDRPAFYRLTLLVVALSSQPLVFFKLCIMNTLVFFLLSQSRRSLRNDPGWPAYPLPRLDQKAISRLSEYDDVTRDPFSTLPRPPNAKSTTDLSPDIITVILSFKKSAHFLGRLVPTKNDGTVSGEGS